MITTPDIINRIQSDFGDSAVEATKILEDAIEKNAQLNHDRIIRCIIYLSEKRLDRLRETIKQAIGDWRDVIGWAEDGSLEISQTQKRQRDFNKPFENS